MNETDGVAAVLAVGGREFKVVGNSNLRHDLATQREIHRAGLEGMQMESGETPEMFSVRVMRTACVKGDVLELLGCLLMPTDCEKWTPKVGHATAEFLAEIEEPDQKRIIQAQINSVLFSFMQAGLLSFIVSTRSSLHGEYEKQRRPSETAESRTTETGPN